MEKTVILDLIDGFEFCFHCLNCQDVISIFNYQYINSEGVVRFYKYNNIKCLVLDPFLGIDESLIEELNSKSATLQILIDEEKIICIGPNLQYYHRIKPENNEVELRIFENGFCERSLQSFEEYKDFIDRIEFVKTNFKMGFLNKSSEIRLPKSIPISRISSS